MNSFSHKMLFSEWSTDLVPAVASGVYAIWKQDELVYCGMSGRNFDYKAIQTKTKHGLVKRLQAHASGRLSGDQFCVYVANRLVIPSLTLEQQAKFGSGELTLNTLTKAYIREHLSFQFALTKTGTEAFALEAKCRNGEVFAVKPLLNPLV